MRLPRDFHAQWHSLFGNMTVGEAHDFMDAVMRGGLSWTHDDLDALRARIMRADRRAAA